MNTFTISGAGERGKQRNREELEAFPPLWRNPQEHGRSTSDLQHGLVVQPSEHIPGIPMPTPEFSAAKGCRLLIRQD